MNNYIFLIPLFPLIGVIFNLFIGRKTNKNLISIFACSMMAFSFIVSVFGFFSLLRLSPEHRHLEQILFEWIPVGDFVVDAGLWLDPLSAVMILVVSGVGFLIHIYSIKYMSEEDVKGFARYFVYLNLFAFFMLILVLANNFLLMFVGWEGVGLCSYLLIGFWFTDMEKAEAGKKAFIVNRVGDFGFTLAMLLIFAFFGTLNFQEVFGKANYLTYGGGFVTAITLLLFVGATGKSAQIPLYVWLPDAMAGPTPVSALIHAATMVTAGVYMVARCNALFTLAPISMSVVAIIGVITAVFAASIGLFQNDIKKVLAYSTISQLGYMFLGCGVGAFSAGIFHLVTHAFFKALLFLGAGSVIHYLHHEQDIRNMGGLKKHLPITYWTFLIAVIGITGVVPPLSSGFFSKDEILWNALNLGGFGVWLWLLGFIGAGMTAFYMFRLFFVTFHGESRLSHEASHHLEHHKENVNTMTFVLIVLAILSMIGGYIGLPSAIYKTNYIHSFLSPVLGGHGEAVIHEATHEVAHEAVAELGHSKLTELIAMGVSFLMGLIGMLSAYYLYIMNPGITGYFKNILSPLHNLLYNKYYIDEIYAFLISNPGKKFADILWKSFDIKVVDGAVNGVAILLEKGSGEMKRVQTGYVRNYALAMFIGVVVILGYLLVKGVR